MSSRIRGLLTMGLLVGSVTSQAAVVIDVSEVAGDVVFASSGTLNLTGALSASPASYPYSNEGIISGSDNWYYAQGNRGSVNVYQLTGWSGPFGTNAGLDFHNGPEELGSPTWGGSSTGTNFAIWGPKYNPGYAVVFVGAGFKSGSEITGGLTFANRTFASMGLTPGVYVYTLPNDTITLRIGSQAVVAASVSSTRDLTAADSKVKSLEQRLTLDPYDPEGAQVRAAIAACDASEVRDPSGTYLTRIEWQGGCVNGKRNGRGTLTLSQYMMNNGAVAISPMRRARSVGTLVAGRRAGLWCIEEDAGTVFGIENTYRPPGSCDLFGGEVVLTDLRRSQSGDWKLPGGSGLKLPADYVDAQSAGAIAAATAGKKQLSLSPLVTESPSVADLLPKGRFTFHPSMVDRAGKRVAVLIASTTAEELEHFKRDREALVAAIAGEPPKAQAVPATPAKPSGRDDGLMSRGRASFSGPDPAWLAEQKEDAIREFQQASDPQRMLRTIVMSLRKIGFTVGVESDLASLASGSYEYALVLEWRSLTDFSRWSQYGRMATAPEKTQSFEADPDIVGSDPSLVAGQAIGGLLFNRKLEVVRQCPLEAPIYLLDRNQSNDNCASNEYYPCDTTYLRRLSGYYSEKWSEAPRYEFMSYTPIDHALAGCFK